MPCRPSPLAALALAALGCAPPPGGPAPTVLIVTVDTVSERILEGNGDLAWNTAPRIHAFLEESATFPNTLSPRGLTSVALSTMLTGTYPRDHGVRDNGQDNPTRTTLLQAFHDAGYLTLGFSANQCHLLEGPGTDEAVCTASDEDVQTSNQHLRDASLVDRFVARLGGLTPDRPVFAWVHLNEPHWSYDVVPEWYDAFHPEPYAGDLDPASADALAAVTLGERAYGAEDARHLEAIYASQVRSADGQVGRVLDALVAAGRWDDAVVAVGADHGEELAEHHRYFFHGCSPYNDVLDVVWGIRGRGGLGAGLVFDGYVSLADVAPTIADLSGALAWPDDVPGRTLAPALDGGRDDPVPVFFERSTRTAGVVSGTWKLVLSAGGPYDGCPPFNEDPAVYPGQPTELYELATDPGEAADRAAEEAATVDALEDLVCGWILEAPWAPAPGRHPLVQRCQGER